MMFFYYFQLVIRDANYEEKGFHANQFNFQINLGLCSQSYQSHVITILVYLQYMYSNSVEFIYYLTRTFIVTSFCRSS